MNRKTTSQRWQHRRLALLLGLLMLCGCLDFGEKEETTSPTTKQIDACRKMIYLQLLATIKPLGLKHDATGIDLRFWFKFETTETDLSKVFDVKVVDTSLFTSTSAFVNDSQDPVWWDTKGKTTFIGGHVDLPKAKFMDVAAEKTASGYVVYISWWEL